MANKIYVTYEHKRPNLNGLYGSVCNAMDFGIDAFVGFIPAEHKEQTFTNERVGVSESMELYFGRFIAVVRGEGALTLLRCLEAGAFETLWDPRDVISVIEGASMVAAYEHLTQYLGLEEED